MQSSIRPPTKPARLLEARCQTARFEACLFLLKTSGSELPDGLERQAAGSYVRPSMEMTANSFAVIAPAGWSCSEKPTHLNLGSRVRPSRRTLVPVVIRGIPATSLEGHPAALLPRLPRALCPWLTRATGWVRSAFQRPAAASSES